MTAVDSSRFVSRAPKLGHYPALDGLRGISVVMVILAHANYENFASFAGSVDVFFVVSGFLITTLILEEDRKTGRVDTKNFYIRRGLRLLPALYTVLVFTLIGGFLVGNDNKYHLWDQTKNDVLCAVLYVYHVVHPVGREVVDGGAPQIRPLIHLWTLSVEEHFYLIVVALMMVVIRFKLSRVLIGALMAMWVGIGLARATGHVGPLLAWYQRPDSLMLGVVIAMVNARMATETSERAKQNWTRAVWAAAAMVMVVTGIGTGFAGSHMIKFSPPEGKQVSDQLLWGQFGFSLVAAGVATMVLGMFRVRDHKLASILSWKPFQGLGRRSYVIYLVHVPLFWIPLVGLDGVVPRWTVAVGYLIAMPIVVELIHRYIEQPALKLKSKRAHVGVDLTNVDAG